MLSPSGLRFAGRRFPVSVGRGGISSSKREGDGATPCGIHRITGLYYRADRLARPVDWAVPIGPRDLWSDDPRDASYNTHVRAPYRPSHERLRRADPLYDLVLLTDWNWPDAVPDWGSAIFLHLRRGPGIPTAGCIAFRRRDLLWILERIRPGARVVVR